MLGSLSFRLGIVTTMIHLGVSKSWEEHVTHLRSVLESLRRYSYITWTYGLAQEKCRCQCGS